jgi:hypothetical protein
MNKKVSEIKSDKKLKSQNDKKLGEKKKQNLKTKLHYQRETPRTYFCQN